MMNKVYLCDCLDFMKNIEDNYYELAIVDPPYGIGVDCIRMGKGQKFTKKKWDIKPKKEYFIELFRISENQIIWGGNYFLENIYKLENIIIWDKIQKEGITFSMAEIAMTNIKKPIQIYKKTYHSGNNQYMKQYKKIHPTQKPVALYKWLLQNYAKPGDKIFDSHVGSGSSRIAAYDLDYHFEGCEIDKDYWNDQEKRFKKEKAIIDNEYYLPDEDNLLFKGLI